jgi:SARP family transcriptional regulator, regulator of embCAB operon
MTQQNALFVMLGPLQVLVDGQAVAMGTPKQRAVLAALLVNRNRPVSADALIAAVWGDEPPAEARASLHAYVSNLRRLLTAAGVDGRQLIEKVPPGYRLNVADDDVDLGRVVQARSRAVAEAAAGRFEQASEHFRTALALWRDSVLADLRGFAFAESFAIALDEDKVSLSISRAQAEIAAGRADVVIPELEALVVEHPYREPLWAQLITAYYLARRQTDALEAYQRLRAALDDDLGIDPDPALRDLHERILRQAPLDIAGSARATAAETLMETLHRDTNPGRAAPGARLRAASGQIHPLVGAATRIGRMSDNDIVVTDATVSRRHAVIIDTGIGFVINDAGSVNGIELAGRRIRGSATLSDGDRLQIGDTTFVFELSAAQADTHPT